MKMLNAVDHAPHIRMLIVDSCEDEYIWSGLDS